MEKHKILEKINTFYQTLPFSLLNIFRPVKCAAAPRIHKNIEQFLISIQVIGDYSVLI